MPSSPPPSTEASFTRWASPAERVQLARSRWRYPSPTCRRKRSRRRMVPSASAATGSDGAGMANGVLERHERHGEGSSARSCPPRWMARYSGRSRRPLHFPHGPPSEYMPPMSLKASQWRPRHIHPLSVWPSVMSSWLMSAPSSNGSGSPQMKVWRRLGHLGPRGGVGVEAVPVREREQPQVQAGAGGAHVALRVVAGRVEAPAAPALRAGG